MQALSPVAARSASVPPAPLASARRGLTPGGRRMATASTDDAGAAGLDTPRTALERQRLGLRKKREALRQAQQRTPALGLGANE